MKWVRRGGYSAIWLMGATLLTKLIGVLQKIPLQNLGGDAVFGLYNMVYPIYQFMMALAVAGLPTAISYSIAKENNSQVQKRLLYSSLLLLGLLSAGIGAFTYFSADVLARIIGNEQLSLIIKVMSIALFITPLLAGYRGFYQGRQLASVSSLSQLLEQVVRVFVMVLILYIGVKAQWSDVHIVAGVMWGASAGAVLTIGWLFYIMRTEKAIASNKESVINWKLISGDIGALLKLGLPAAVAAVIVPLVALVDTFTIPRILHQLSYQADEIAIQYGLYSRIQPLIQLVSMLFAAIIAGLIPNMVKSKQAQSYMHVSITSQAVLIQRYTLMIGAAASIGLYLLAEPINYMLYTDSNGIELFNWLSFSALPSCLLAIQAPLLQMLGKYRLPFVLVLSSAFGKALINYWLVPIYGIEGAAIAANITLYITAAIGYLVIIRAYLKSKLTNDKLRWRRPNVIFLLALFTMITIICFMNEIAGASTHLLEKSRIIITAYTLVTVCFGAGCFGIVMLLLKGITREEWNQLKWKS